MVINKNVLELEIRRNIYQYIQKFPGVHFRKICRELKIAKSTLSYHLKILKKFDLIITERDGKYLSYYISRDVRKIERTYLNIIRRNTPRKIVLYILVMASASQIEISKTLRKHPTTIEFHLKKLVKMGIIEPTSISEGVCYTSLKNIILRKPVGKEVIYRLKDSHLTYELFSIYNKKRYFNDDFINSVFVTLKFICSNDKQMTHRTMKEYIELIEERMYDVLPHPYHI